MVKFLDKKYDIPADLDHYIQLLNYFERMKDNLVLSIKQQVELAEGKLINDSEMIPTFEAYIREVIQKLCNAGIYDRTVSDYLNGNKGFELFSQANSQALEQFKKYFLEEIEAFERGMQAAEDRAMSNVTGSGVRVYTSSFVTLAASAAYNYSCAKSQFNKANEQYKQEIGLISSQGASIKEKNEINYINKVYFPAIESAMAVFVFSIMDKYITDLIKNNQFDERTLKYVDFKKSEGLLENLNISNNAHAILENAFLACPFNESVYEKAVDYGLIDVETIKTANNYCPNSNPIQRIINKCKIANGDCNLSDEYNRILPYIPIIATHQGKSESEVLQALFEKPYKQYLKTFSAYKKIVSTTDKCEIKKFVVDNISNSSVDLDSKSSEQIRLLIYNLIDRKINPENYALLSDIGYNFYEDEINFSQPIVEYWVSNIFSVIYPYILECRSEREKLDELKIEYNQNIKTKSGFVTSLENEVSSLGFFALSQKREMKKKIEDAKLDLEKYKREAPYIFSYRVFVEQYL